MLGNTIYKQTANALIKNNKPICYKASGYFVVSLHMDSGLHRNDGCLCWNDGGLFD